jgi:hypothetical protein
MCNKFLLIQKVMWLGISANYVFLNTSYYTSHIIIHIQNLNLKKKETYTQYFNWQRSTCQVRGWANNWAQQKELCSKHCANYVS